ncbi:hypothetical protein ABTD98_22765, partial [Acinetobacter baumannii]
FTSEENVVITKNKPAGKVKKNGKASDGDTSIEIDNTGLHIRKNNLDGKGKQIEIDENGIRVKSEADKNTPDHPVPPVE